MKTFNHGDIVSIHACSYECCVYYGVFNDDVKLGYVWEQHTFDPEGRAEEGFLILPILVGYTQKVAFEIPDGYVPDIAELVFANKEICYPFDGNTQLTPLVGQLAWHTGNWKYEEGKVLFIQETQK